MKRKILIGAGILALSMLLPTAYAAPVSKAATPAAITTQVKDAAETSFDFSTKTLKLGNITGKYVQIKNLSDEAKQKKINTILKADAQAILKSIKAIDPDATVDLKVSGKYIKDTDLFVVTYSGSYSFKKNAHPTNFCYESVIDVNKASRADFSSKALIGKLKKAIQNGKFQVNGENSIVIAALQEYLKGLSEDDLAAILKNFNFKTTKDSIAIPDSFMYETKDSIELVLPTLHVLGDYFKISIDTSALK